MNKNALVISGGGAKGAWGVGIVKGLKQTLNKPYNIVIGTSTGSLMGPLILGDKMTELEEVYTSVTSDDIFNVNPFNKKKDIKLFAAAMRVLVGKKSIGETKKLKNLIEKFVDISIYNELVNSDMLFGSTVTNLKKGITEVKTIIGNTFTDRNNNPITNPTTESYNAIVNWIWASANQPIFMSLYEDEEGASYVDGGLRDFVTIKYVLDHKLADEIDVVIHNTPELIKGNYQTGNLLSILMRTLNILTTDVAANDIENAVLNLHLDKEVNINFYYMNEEQVALIPNSLVFEKDKMKELLDSGFNSIIDNSCRVDHCTITTDGHIIPGG